MKIDVETSRLDAIMPSLIAKSRASAGEVVDYLAARFVREVIALTVRSTGRPKGAGVASTAAEARREHTAYLEARIREKRLLRWGAFSRSGRNASGFYSAIHIPKKQVKAYLREAKRRQGELAAGWNAAAAALRVNHPPGTAFVKRHRTVHGSYAKTVAPASVIAHITWEHSKGTHGNMDSVAAAALKIVNDKALAASARNFATNVARAAAALRR